MGKTKSLAELKDRLRSMYPELNQKYTVTKLGIFGSYARAEQRQESDLDVLVTFEEPPSQFKFIELENLLSDFLGVKVDLVMEDALKPGLKMRILQEVETV